MFMGDTAVTLFFYGASNLKQGMHGALAPCLNKDFGVGLSQAAAVRFWSAKAKTSRSDSEPPVGTVALQSASCCGLSFVRLIWVHH